MKTTERTVDLSIHHDEHATHVWAVTGWYEADQVPVRSGVYEVEDTGFIDFGPAFRYFDGVNWYVGSDNPDKALRNFQMHGTRATVTQRWRGLTERAK